MTAFVMGIDPSMRATGIAWRASHTGQVQMATIRTSVKDGPVPARWAMVRRALADIDDAHYPPAPLRVVMEEYPYALIKMGARGVPDRFGLRGIIMDYLHRTGGMVQEVSTTAIKAFAGSGSHDKDDMIAAAEALGYSPEDDNQADALFALLIGEHRCGMTLPGTVEDCARRDNVVNLIDFPPQWTEAL